MAGAFASPTLANENSAFIVYNPVDTESVQEIFGTIIPELHHRGIMVAVSEVTGLEAPKLSLNYRVYVGLREIEAAARPRTPVRSI